ncbi:MAG TPA: DUF3823 domain-containing protein [Draconibacterium sp.]|nr:DUF3823 domain-containing protein [Draconibacterium sp.]
MKTKILLLSVSIILFIFTGCQEDNYDAPGSLLTGRVVYNGEAVGVRSNGVQIELWQHGYANFEKIPVYVNQDGTFSAVLFDGDYKLVRLAGAPWEASTDSIDVEVRGGTTVDVPVVPFFNVENVSFSKSGGNVTATFTVNKVSSQGTLNRVVLYLGKNYLTDNGYNIASVALPAADITLGATTTLSVAIPATVNTDFIYARVGVETSGVGQLLYSTSEKVALN